MFYKFKAARENFYLTLSRLKKLNLLNNIRVTKQILSQNLQSIPLQINLHYLCKKINCKILLFYLNICNKIYEYSILGNTKRTKDMHGNVIALK